MELHTGTLDSSRPVKYDTNQRDGSQFDGVELWFQPRIALKKCTVPSYLNESSCHWHKSASHIFSLIFLLKFIKQFFSPEMNHRRHTQNSMFISCYFIRWLVGPSDLENLWTVYLSQHLFISKICESTKVIHKKFLKVYMPSFKKVWKPYKENVA